jgi:nucleoid-associated protein YgaU
MALFGLLDFAKDMGRRLFSNDNEAEERIKSHIEDDNPGIDGLNVKFDGGVVSLSGKAASAEALEKAVLMAGNVKGVESVNIDDVDGATPEEAVQFYVIERGDTLSAIAKRFYGKASLYPKIFEANREVIKDPDLIFPGQKIRIPGND